MCVPEFLYKMLDCFKLILKDLKCEATMMCPNHETSSKILIPRPLSVF
uniref:Uncharacterized protein n=1 Tax=Rhizophora mucronata TaxID=61149 RepID=A0A2P2PTZ5_RHIMU